MADNKILVTGSAGFIGAALVIKLLNNNLNVIGIDNLNNYYDRRLKKDRLKTIEKNSLLSEGKWKFIKIDLIDRKKVFKLINKIKPTIVVNLAAQAGVRYSINNPEVYIQSNIVGFSNLIDACRINNVKNFIFASSSSVYGANRKIPFNENDNIDHPVSLYAATKKSNELIAHSYSHLYGMPCTGLRFFTVYGPWGRPDMAPMIFTKSIFEKKPINVFNFGKMLRDFTYIDDIVEAIYRCCFKPATSNNKFNYLNPSASESFAPYKIFNIGNSQPIELLDFINVLENEIGIKSIKNFIEVQKGDVLTTFSNTEKLKKWIDFSPKTKLKKGIKLFIKWYKKYYKI